jgi:hypothetical protein
MAGTIKLKEVAASITPAENPSITPISLSETFRVNRTGSAPAPVAKPVTALATKPSRIVYSDIFSTQAYTCGVCRIYEKGGGVVEKAYLRNLDTKGELSPLRMK